jgi:hypothetical protein
MSQGIHQWGPKISVQSPVLHESVPAINDSHIYPPLTVYAQNPWPFEAPALTLPPGYGFYILKAVSNGWTDNRDAGQRPLEGFDHPDEDEQFPPALRAALVGVFGEGGTTYVASYTPQIDRSRGGNAYYANRGGSQRIYYWLMNDRHYGDNDGSATVTFAVFKLEV